MKIVIAKLEGYVTEQHYRACHANSKPGDVNKRENPVFPQRPKGGFEIVFEHMPTVYSCMDDGTQIIWIGCMNADKRNPFYRGNPKKLPVGTGLPLLYPTSFTIHD
jgi:hypothetical protein